MVRLFLHWLISALTLLVVSHYADGFVVDSFISALIAVIVIGIVNAIFGLLLKVLTIPGLLTFGLFSLIINAIILGVASKFVMGFAVTTIKGALLGALAISIMHLLFGLWGAMTKQSSIKKRAKDCSPDNQSR
jgi:putative membrane protein